MDVNEAHKFNLEMLQQYAQAQKAKQAQTLGLISALMPKLTDKLNTSLGRAPTAPQPQYSGESQAVTPENVTSYPLPPADLNIQKIMNAIGKFESSGNYGARGPVLRGGDRALGKYQVMASNIPSWSKEALGYSVTPQEFINNPQLQDTIAQFQMSKYFNKYGTPQDVASMWFSGRPSRNNAAKDILGTSVPEYIKGVMNYLQD